MSDSTDREHSRGAGWFFAALLMCPGGLLLAAGSIVMFAQVASRAGWDAVGYLALGVMGGAAAVFFLLFHWITYYEGWDKATKTK